MKNNFRNNFLLLNLYKEKSLRSKIDSQLLYGDNFKVLNKNKKWKKIKIESDGYKGFISNKNFASPIKTNFKVFVLKSSVYRKPHLNHKTNKYLSFNSRLKIIERKGKFGKFDKYWVKLSDLKKISHKNKNIFKNIKIFKNTKYLWGGKSFKGIDCSALVQIFFNYNNIYCPRDSVDQEKYFKKKIKFENKKKNDIIFWKGHVAVALSTKKIIHAYGPMKKVVVMDTKKAIERIERTAKLKVTSMRRV